MTRRGITVILFVHGATDRYHVELGGIPLEANLFHLRMFQNAGGAPILYFSTPEATTGNPGMARQKNGA